MQTANAELMRAGKESLKGKWGLAIAVSITYCVLIGALQNVKNVGPIVSLLISGPLAGGLAIFYLSVARGTEAKFEQLFDGFKSYATYLLAYILMVVFIMLWALLLIIPGIIAAFSYAMTYYVIADNPTISAFDALKKSKAIMVGNKGKYFGLILRFFGWALLAILTAGIGFIWLIPYMQATTAKFYEDIKGGDNVVGSTPEPTVPTPIAPFKSEVKDAEIVGTTPTEGEQK
ncbi:MAG: DUF975 family protein [Candidatus Moranbacteria bacterium]|nr:DUF975 family protein [Candidatus Moranbacteria bacterium]